MKTLTLVAAALGLFTVSAPAAAYTPTPVAPVSAAAITLVPVAQVVQRGDDRRWDNRGRGWDRGRHRGWDRGRHRGWDRGRNRGWERSRRVCRTEWRRGDRQRTCRQVRYR